MKKTKGKKQIFIRGVQTSSYWPGGIKTRVQLRSVRGKMHCGFPKL